MTAREDFSDDEWFQLRSAPWEAAMGVIEVDPSGTFTAGREIGAVEAELAASQFDEGLIGLVTRDLLDMDAVGGEDKPNAGPTAATADALAQEGFPEHVLEMMAALNAVLDAKVEPAEGAAFRAWLVRLADAAAEAGREGLAGLTGPKVSDDEATFLDRLRAALGVD